MSLSDLVAWLVPTCGPTTAVQWVQWGLELAGSIALAWLMVRRRIWPFNRRKEAIPLPVTGTTGRWSLSAGTKFGIGAVGYLVLVTGFEYRIKNGEPYRMAVAAARASPRVQEALGGPFEEGWFVEAELREGAEGFAVLGVPLIGKERRGQLKVRAIKDDGRWKLAALSLELGRCGEPVEIVTVADGLPR